MGMWVKNEHEVYNEGGGDEHTGSRKWVAASLVVDPLTKTYAL